MFAVCAVSTLPPVSTPHFQVERSGKGSPLIFIPGLDCGGKVWGPTVDKLKGAYTCWVLTLPGFGGVKPLATGPYLSQVRDEIITFIHDRHIKKPVLIGHSLGGFLAWSIAINDSKDLGGIVCVDGVPYLGSLGNPLVTAKQYEPFAAKIEQAMATMSHDQFKAQSEAAMKQMISSAADMAWVEKVSGPPDQATTGKVYAEMMTTDLRPEVSNVTCPVFQMMAGKNYDAKMLPVMEQRYKDQAKGVKDYSFYDFADAKHFIFLDQPAEFMKELNQFLAKVAPASH